MSRGIQHGGFGTRLYRIWNGMKQRCSNPNDPSYRIYGGRGIKVCDDWIKFVPFRDWALANGYEDTLTIDRINPDGNYEPSNCRWATKKEQAHNRRHQVLLTYHGETKPLFEWATILGIEYKILDNRIRYHGFTVERAFEQPVKRCKK